MARLSLRSPPVLSLAQVPLPLRCERHELRRPSPGEIAARVPLDINGLLKPQLVVLGGGKVGQGRDASVVLRVHIHTELGHLRALFAQPLLGSRDDDGRLRVAVEFLGLGGRKPLRPRRRGERLAARVVEFQTRLLVSKAPNEWLALEGKIPVHCHVEHSRRHIAVCPHLDCDNIRHDIVCRRIHCVTYAHDHLHLIDHVSRQAVVREPRAWKHGFSLKVEV
mmetsp:Transcript_18566/g.54338  ORF Transcript_18566/g.54338 Transcript_18566/m.54338 type:complete len:222 (-) Transcript_18566:204-869(-)